MPIILATWEAEIGRIGIQDHSRQVIDKTPVSKNNQRKMDWRCGSSGRSSALQVRSTEFKHQSPAKKIMYINVCNIYLPSRITRNK
jgi:hypothetical protein